MGLLCTFVSPAPAETASLTWVTDGTINSIMPFGHRVYIGGGFTYLGPVTGPGAPLSRRTGARPRRFPHVHGWVRAAIPDGSGGYYIGGSFRVGRAAEGLAHVRADGSVDSRFSAKTGGEVFALARVGSTIWVGGDFGRISGVRRGGLAAVDARTGVLRPPDPNPDGTVQAMAVVGHTVYLAGPFRVVGGKPRDGLAAIDARTGAVTAWHPFPRRSLNVESLTTWGSTVYAGGLDETRDSWVGFVAAIDSRARPLWTAHTTIDDPTGLADVNALSASKSWLDVGGAFTRAAGVRRNGLARLNRRTGALTRWHASLDNASGGIEVSTLARSGSTLYVGGTFTAIGDATRTNIAAIDAGTARARGWQPGADQRVEALAVSGSTIYAGGFFESVAGWQRRNLGVLDLRTGRPTRTNPDANGPVDAFAARGSRLYVGGEFTSIGGHRRHRLAALDDSGGEVTAWNPGANGPVYAFAVGGDRIYAGGGFTRIGGTTRRRLVALAADSGAVLAWNPGANGAVRALDVSGSRIYVGGSFDRIGPRRRAYLAAVNSAGVVASWNAHAEFVGDCGERFGGSSGCDLGPGIWAIVAAGRSVYVGGVFTGIGDLPFGYLAAIDPRSGRAQNWHPGVTDVTLALERSRSALFAAGNFGVTAFSLNTGHGLAWAPSVPSVSALGVDAHHVYLGAEIFSLESNVFQVFRAPAG